MQKKDRTLFYLYPYYKKKIKIKQLFLQKTVKSGCLHRILHKKVMETTLIRTKLKEPGGNM
ncbi:hypothetical protein D1B31_15735 [Neobacillus notoginsengisoli]|uniref:Uncharacterized protein n=1 Tax=Neobacillus notoginsengisoli TaxID=1578198 RepID=A0A417YQT2_9BACI|nr:hypothetical protein D1B31_15735 [Neobacillus notoginsengisoli]